VIGRAVAEDVGELVEIVAVGDGGRGILSPCGRCRQVLSDRYTDLRVIVSTGNAAMAIPVAELLPWGNRWDPDYGSIPLEAQDSDSVPGVRPPSRKPRR
jgi:cytidine deaminase